MYIFAIFISMQAYILLLCYALWNFTDVFLIIQQNDYEFLYCVVILLGGMEPNPQYLQGMSV